MRTETLVLDDASSTDPKAVEEKIHLAQELATVLRRNVVQARKVEGKDAWSVHITEDTELGDNTSIKSPPAVESNRRARKQEKEQEKSLCCST